MQHKSASLSAQESMFNLTHKKKKRRRKECQQEKQTNKHQKEIYLALKIG